MSKFDFPKMRADDLAKLAEWLRSRGDIQDDAWAEAVQSASEDLEFALIIGAIAHDLHEALDLIRQNLALKSFQAPDLRRIDVDDLLARYERVAS